MTDKTKWYMRWLPASAKQPETPKADNAQIHLSSISFNDGTKIALDRSSILILTGPNNVGKSSVLRELRDSLVDGSARRVLVKHFEIQRSGSPADFKEVISREGLKGKDDNVIRVHMREYFLSQVASDYEKSFIGTQPMNFFVTYLGAA